MSTTEGQVYTSTTELSTISKNTMLTWEKQTSVSDRPSESSGFREALWGGGGESQGSSSPTSLLPHGSSATGEHHQPKDRSRGSLRWPWPTLTESHFENLWGCLWLSKWPGAQLASYEQELVILDDLLHEGQSWALNILQEIHIIENPHVVWD